jgi:hypothetical protein
MLGRGSEMAGHKRFVLGTDIHELAPRRILGNVDRMKTSMALAAIFSEGLISVELLPVET